MKFYFIKRVYEQKIWQHCYYWMYLTYDTNTYIKHELQSAKHYKFTVDATLLSFNYYNFHVKFSARIQCLFCLFSASNDSFPFSVLAAIHERVVRIPLQGKLLAWVAWNWSGWWTYVCVCDASLVEIHPLDHQPASNC